MPYLFTKTPGEIPGDVQSGGSLLMLIGTLTFSGSYATGGDVATLPGNNDLDTLLKKIGRGKVFGVLLGRGLDGEWDTAARKLKLYTAGAAEMGAGAYAAGYTATPVPAIVWGR
jgi:hypothetical protein